MTNEKNEAKKIAVTPQVPALNGMTPLGIKPNVEIKWIDEVDTDENGDDYKVSSESACGTYSITPNWYDSDAEKPVDFTLDMGGKNKTTQRSVAACKKIALEIVNRPPPIVYTTEQLIQNAANAYHMNKNGSATTRKWAERDADKAIAKFGVDVRAIPMDDACKAAIEKMTGKKI